MTRRSSDTDATETDSRFPSGRWKGFYLQGGRFRMDLLLTFVDGRLEGDGEDPLGPFRVAGNYDPDKGEVTFVKVYVQGHAVNYRGFAESPGKGIWGTWKIWRARDGFHIWPAELTQEEAAHETESIEEQGMQPARV